LIGSPSLACYNFPKGLIIRERWMVTAITSSSMMSLPSSVNSAGNLCSRKMLCASCSR
jgi:hypothetical protein